jgi:hypothetical protein
MTVRYQADVFCDRCGQWVNGAISTKPGGLARKALAFAKRCGWSRDVRSTLLDLCPNCLRATRTGAPAPQPTPSPGVPIPDDKPWRLPI